VTTTRARRLLVVTESPWFVHPVDGDDKNDGRTKRTALRTFAELDRRVQIEGLTATHEVMIKTRWSDDRPASRRSRGATSAIDR